MGTLENTGAPSRRPFYLALFVKFRQSLQGFAHKKSKLWAGFSFVFVLKYKRREENSQDEQWGRNKRLFIDFYLQIKVLILNKLFGLKKFWTIVK